MDTSIHHPEPATNVPDIRRRLRSLSEECESLCAEEGWLGHGNRNPNYRLLYSSVESYESGSGVAIVGMNPAGDGRDADAGHAERPFRDPGYSAYLDDRWRDKEAGSAPLQRVIQGLAAILVGASPSEAMAVVESPESAPAERLPSDASALLRNTPSMNIIPFRASNLPDVPPLLREGGERIGWRLLGLARPRPGCIITLANQVSKPPWRTILQHSGQPRKPDYEKTINKNLRRTYREVRLVRGPLKGALLVGLPAVVRDKARADVTKPLFETLGRRLEFHGLT